jgi:alkanesulfonate monooxygenase SsuD/methylene tetrahydromethanopterin reductase-like flavin-dependent oxidoreductase (luciferase family)
LKGEFAALGVDFEERNELFDEALAVLPLHWSGEPFDFEGKHFSARNIQSLPRPAQNPIPIWIGGNSKRARRRVAERCQGWMPLTGPAEMFATTRTPAPGTLAELTASIEEIERAAAPRSVKLDFAMAYTDPSLTEPRADVDRQREALARFEAAGFTWLIVNRPSAPREGILEFIAEFAQTYIHASAKL